MGEINLESNSDLVLHDFVNDWILEPIVDSKDRQKIVFRLTTKGKDYFKILNKNPGYPFKKNPTWIIMIKKEIVTPIIKKEGKVGYNLTPISEQHHICLKTWKEKNEKN